MVDVLKIDAIDQLKPFLNNDNIIEIALRNKNKKFKAFQKISLDTLGHNQDQKKVVQNLMNNLNRSNEVNVENMQLLNDVAKLDQLNLLMNGLNLCVSCIGFEIVSKKIDEMSKDINVVLSVIKTTSDLHLDLEFNKCVSEHEIMLDHRKTQDYFSLDTMEKLVALEYDTLKLLVDHFLTNTVNNKKVLLYSIMTMTSMLSTSLKYFDEMYYLEYKDKIHTGDLWHTSHDKWMSVFDKIVSTEFIYRLQDYGFLELGLSTFGCDALYINVIDSVLGQKQEIVDNQELLQIFNNKDILDLFTDYNNHEVRNSIVNGIENDSKVNSDEEIKKVLNKCMQQVGIMY